MKKCGECDGLAFFSVVAIMTNPSTNFRLQKYKFFQLENNCILNLFNEEMWIVFVKAWKCEDTRFARSWRRISF